MSKPTELNKHIVEGINMGALAKMYYHRAKPERRYNSIQARNMFIRDRRIDFEILNECVHLICKQQVSEFRNYELKIWNNDIK